MRLILLGPPGVGKGTQAGLLGRRLGVPHISTGELLREAIRQGTRAGQQAREIVARGQLVPDALVRRLVEERLAREDCRRGFLLDGYPRNRAQAGELDEILAAGGVQLDRALELTAGPEVLVYRLSGRRSCPGCGAVFHVGFHPPAREGMCDACGTALVQREDDREATIRRRLEVYEESTRPLVEHYRRRGLLVSVAADEDVPEVARRVSEALGVAA